MCTNYTEDRVVFHLMAARLFSTFCHCMLNRLDVLSIKFDSLRAINLIGQYAKHFEKTANIECDFRYVQSVCDHASVVLVLIFPAGIIMVIVFIN